MGWNKGLLFFVVIDQIVNVVIVITITINTIHIIDSISFITFDIPINIIININNPINIFSRLCQIQHSY